METNNQVARETRFRSSRVTTSDAEQLYLLELFISTTYQAGWRLAILVDHST